MKSAKKDLFDKIIRIYPKLSPKKRRVADLIMNDYKNIFLMTAREIAEKCDVSEPTIIRFSVDMGFSGYAEFLHYMKGVLHTELTSAERLTRTRRKPDEGTTIQRYCQNAIHNLQNLMTSVADVELKKIASSIYKADRVYVVGYRASATLAYHFGYLLKKVRENVTIDTDLSWELMDALNECGRNTLMVVIAFPRYPRRTIEILKYANQCNVQTIGLSDTPTSPIITFADQYVMIDIEGVSFVDPFAHIIAFLGALVHEIAFIDNEEAMRCISKFDSGVKAANEFYTEDEIDQRLAYRLTRPQITSLWPQKEEKLS
jgi:DNA-binding MurR/RpiR family transcriptional regulator